MISVDLMFTSTRKNTWHHDPSGVQRSCKFCMLAHYPSGRNTPGCYQDGQGTEERAMDFPFLNLNVIFKL